MSHSNEEGAVLVSLGTLDSGFALRAFGCKSRAGPVFGEFSRACELRGHQRIHRGGYKKGRCLGGVDKRTAPEFPVRFALFLAKA